jgi:hypothetical protein
VTRRDKKVDDVLTMMVIQKMIAAGLMLLLQYPYVLSSSDSSPSSNFASWTATPFHRIVREEVVYNRWRSVIRKVVLLPKGIEVDYDIIDQRGRGAVTIFAWNSRNKTATLVKEYQPGPHQFLMGCAAGMIDENDDDEARGDHHDSNRALLAAVHELEEELHLRGGTWYSLTNKPLVMDKYSKTQICPYLVIDPYMVKNPRPLDDEEEIEIIQDVTIEEIIQLIQDGCMNMVGSWACLLAINKLRELGEIT